MPRGISYTFQASSTSEVETDWIAMPGQSLRDVIAEHPGKNPNDYNVTVNGVTVTDLSRSINEGDHIILQTKNYNSGLVA